MLPATGPLPHPYYDVHDAFMRVTLQVDARERTIDQIFSFDTSRARAA